MSFASTGSGIRLKKIRIKNFKAIDELELDFPQSQMPGDPDSFVMGSGNGQGKTSVLEACVLFLLLAPLKKYRLQETRFWTRRYNRFGFDLYDMLVRSGKPQSVIEGTIELQGKEFSLAFTLNREKKDISFTSSKDSLHENLVNLNFNIEKRISMALQQFTSTLMGRNTDPVIVPSYLLYFHSSRKVQEGSPEVGALVHSEQEAYRDPDFARSRHETPISQFKNEIFRALAGQTPYFETEQSKEPEHEETLVLLNRLLREYADARIEKIRIQEDNTVQFIITSLTNDSSFNIDGLSSGQKEIISTLFLIWKNTLNNPGVVLIDEPELHLNREWHRRFVFHLEEMAPKNQYILATHSSSVFGAVAEESHRFLLQPEDTNTWA